MDVPIFVIILVVLGIFVVLTIILSIERSRMYLVKASNLIVYQISAKHQKK